MSLPLVHRCEHVISTALLWAILIVLATTAAQAQDKPSRSGRSLEVFREHHRQLQAEFAKGLADVARFCDEKQFTEAAATVRRFAKPIDPEDRLLDALPRKVQPNLPADVNADQRYWQAQLRFLQSKYAKDLYLLSRRVLHAGLPSYAYDLVREVADHDPDHISARRLLGYVRYGDEWVTPVAASMYRRRYVWHDDYGWLPGTHVERYERGERFFKGRWISAAKDAELRRDFNNAWEIRTDHYLIKTNHSLERGVQLGKALEDFHRFFFQACAPFFNTPEQMQKLFEGANNSLGASGTPRPYEVHYYRTRDEYNERLIEKIPQIAITNGLYYPGDRAAYFYHDENVNGEETLFHEATHQLFSESQPRERRIAQESNFWVVEGIACYMESFKRDNGRFTVGDPTYVRFQQGRNRYRDDHYYVPLARFSDMGMQAFQTNANIAMNYSQASELSRFFMHYQGGAYRDALIKHLSQIYNDNPRDPFDVQSLEDLTGVNFEELDRQYGEFVGQSEESLRQNAP